MAGVWNGSGQQRVDLNGKPYVAARAFFYEAASGSPLSVYKDYGLGSEHPNPVVANARGVFPYVFLDETDGFFRCRITDRNGNVIDGEDQTVLPIIGPGEGGGGSEVPVDPSAVSQTGDLKHRLSVGPLTGWVRLNGRTIGTAVSGATERANSDTEALYTLLWNGLIDAICPVTGGRGISAAADFAANKPLGLPDFRGRTLAGLDDMGNSAANILSTNIFSISGQGPTVLGAKGGTERHAMTEGEMPAHAHGGETSENGAHTHTLTANTSNNGGPFATWFTGTSGSPNANPTSSDGAHKHTIASAGGGAPHPNVQPTALTTIYIKL